MTRVIILMFFFSLLSCKAQTKKEAISQTSRQVITAIQDSNAKEFRSLIVHRDLRNIGKDEDMVVSDVKYYHKLFSRYLDKKIPLFEVTYLYNQLGQMLVKIPICDTISDSIMTNVKKMHLDILFGPPSLFPLNKITGYELVVNDQDSAQFKPYSYWKERGVAK